MKMQKRIANGQSSFAAALGNILSPFLLKKRAVGDDLGF